MKVYGTGFIERPEADASFGALRETWVDLPADPTREIRFELDSDWDGHFKISRKVVKGCRIKVVIYVPEERAAEVDRQAVRRAVLDSGASYCKLPEVHVTRLKAKRDERHEVSLALRESLEFFARETRVRDAEEKISFAERLALEADEGVKE